MEVEIKISGTVKELKDYFKQLKLDQNQLEKKMSKKVGIKMHINSIRFETPMEPLGLPKNYFSFVGNI